MKKQLSLQLIKTLFFQFKPTVFINLTNLLNYAIQKRIKSLYDLILLYLRIVPIGCRSTNFPENFIFKTIQSLQILTQISDFNESAKQEKDNFFQQPLNIVLVLSKCLRILSGSFKKSNENLFISCVHCISNLWSKSQKIMNQACSGLLFYIQDVNSCQELTKVIYKFRGDKNNQPINNKIINAQLNYFNLPIQLHPILEYMLGTSLDNLSSFQKSIRMIFGRLTTALNIEQSGDAENICIDII